MPAMTVGINKTKFKKMFADEHKKAKTDNPKLSFSQFLISIAFERNYHNILKRGTVSFNVLEKLAFIGFKPLAIEGCKKNGKNNGKNPCKK